jgi:competence protein ComEC
VVAVTLAAASVSYLGVAVGDRVRGQLSRPGDWQIAACDIGQGDAVLVRSLGEVALIDTGPDPQLLRRCLDALGIARIDLLVLSHYDLDHVGGAPAIIGRVGRALLGPVADADDQRLADDLAAHGAAVEHVAKGLTGVLGELGWEVLWPKKKLGAVQPGNDASVTLRVQGIGECANGCLSALFLGDLGEEPQTLLMAANRLSHVSVVKVAHHGSADQNERLYDAIRADVGLIGVGLQNDYGHPTDRLLGILGRAGTLVTRTDLQGMVLVSPRPDGGETVWTERSPPEGRLLRH